MLSEAEGENQKINETVLKGGISNVKYVWHSENGKNTCDKCKALDGKEFDFEDEVPERPHPNCKCCVEIIEDKKDKPNDENDEPCDCMEKIKNIIYEAEIYNSNIETIIKKLNETSAETNIKLSVIEDFAQVIENEKEELYELKSNMSVTDKYLSEFIFRFNPITLTTLRLFQNELKELLISGLTVYDIFESHMNEMKAKKGYDKYYHAKANCEGTILGNTEKLFSILFSVGKEVYDIYYKTTNKVLSFDEAWNDSMNDLKADWHGIQQAKSNLKCGDAVRNVKQHIEKD